MFPYSPAQTHRSSSASHSPAASPLRTGNACQACKKRKTKCTGQPGPCANCCRTGTYCHFDIKLDGRRKHAYEASEIQHRQQFILDALLRSIKYNDAVLVQKLVESIRVGRPLTEIAHVLQDNIKSLKDKMLAREQKITISDLISLALTCLSDSDFRPHGNSKSSIQHHRETHLKVPSYGRAEEMVYHHRMSAKILSKEHSRMGDAASTPLGVPSSAKKRRWRTSKVVRDTPRGTSREAASPLPCDPPPLSCPSKSMQNLPAVGGCHVETSPLQPQSYRDQEQVYTPIQPIFASYDRVGQRCQVPLGYTPSCPPPQANSLRVHYLDEQLTTAYPDFCNSSPQFNQMSPRQEYSTDQPSLQGFQGHGWSVFAAGWPNQAWAGHA